MNHRPGRFLRGILLFLLAYPMASRAEGPSQPPRPPREEQAAFVLADPALTIELVAAEPEVTSPVAIAWDEEGRLFVAEMLDYPTATTSGRIRMLEDRDGDGRYEHATVFADGLPFPNGVLPCYGGVLVTAAPNIWFFRDDDGDGRADERRVVLTGFGEGNTQLRVNGLTWGLDNWIYVANGRSDGAIRVPADPPDRAVSIRRRDARFRLHAVFDPGKRALIPTVVALEAIAGFSQFGLPHDDWGNRFPSWNTIPIRHVVLEQDALDRNPYLAETASVAEILDPTDGGRIFGISPPQARFNRESVAFFNASCGPMIERGGCLPAAYHGNAFVCEPLTQPGPPSRARTVRSDLHCPTGRAGSRIPDIDRPGLPAGQPREWAGRCPLRRGYVPRVGGASPVRARAVAGRRSTSAAGTTEAGSGASGRSRHPTQPLFDGPSCPRPTSACWSLYSEAAMAGGASRRNGCSSNAVSSG